ncbi:MAG: hypothetical protein WBA61_10355 [Aequorivita sp.]
MKESEGLFIPLSLTPGVGAIHLRSLRGADEMAITDTDTKTLINLLESLIQPSPTGDKVHASQIVTADRDRLLAALYISMYGPKIESTVNCKACDQKFDLDFRLDKLLQHYQPPAETLPMDGKYEIEPDICFRLPNGEDELLIDGLSAAEAVKQLFERCLLKGDVEADSEKVQLKMAELAPVLSMNMQAICPECNHNQEVQFDMQSFLLTKLKQERPSLVKEIHYIASQYHWSHQEILNLSRNSRKQYAALIQLES